MLNEQNVDIMNDVEIYKNFTLIAKCPAVETFQWTRRFSRPGEFMLTTNFTQENMEIYSVGNIIFKRDNNEGAFITGRTVMATMEGDMRLIVKGHALSSLLNRRMVTLNGDFTLTPLLSNIVVNNFLASAGTARSMVNDGVRLLPIPQFSNESIPVEYRNRNALDIFNDLCQEHHVGLRVNYNIANKTYDIEFYQPTESIAIFDKEWGNVLEQDFWEDTSREKNVVLVGDNFVHNNHIIGFDRKEVAASEPREGATRFTQTARDTLNRNRATRTLSSQIDVNSVQFQYGKDWDIGSIVLSQNREIGFAEKEIITEIMEFYDQTGRSIEVNTGDYTERG